MHAERTSNPVFPVPSSRDMAQTISASSPGWRQRLLHYLQHHPRTRLVDTFEAVQSLMARDSMLQPLADPVTLHRLTNDRLSSGTAERDIFSCAAPVQAALQEGTPMSLYLHAWIHLHLTHHLCTHQYLFLVCSHVCTDCSFCCESRYATNTAVQHLPQIVLPKQPC